MKLAAADRGAANARTASHFRRLQTASSPSRPAPFGVSAAMGSLRHQDDVAVLKVEVLLRSVPSRANDSAQKPLRRLGDLVVVEGNPLHRRALGTEDDDPRAC